MDEFFLYDDDTCLANTAILASFTPFKFEEMRDHFAKKLKAIIPMRVRLQELFGKQYFIKMTEEEYDEIVPKIWLEKTGIHTQEELAKFVLEIQ